MTSVRTDPILSAFDVPEVLSASPRNTPALLRTIDSPVTAAASGRGTKSNVSRSANPLQTNVAPTVGGGSVVGSTDSVVARTLAPNAGAPNPSSSQSTGFADGPVGMRTFEQIAATEGLPGALPLRSTASNGPFVLNRAWDGSAAASRSAQPRASSTSSNPGTTNTDSPGFSWTTDAYQVLQREADAQGSSGGAATPTATATSEAGPSPMAAGAPPQGSSTQAEADLELLAGRLYERLRYRFRRELLDDRERAGLVLDRVR